MNRSLTNRWYAYYAVFRLRMVNGMQYRAAALAGMATQFFWGLITIMVFVAFYTHSGANVPMQIEQLVAYIWLQQALLALVVLWIRDNELFQLITSGNIAYELCRPIDIYGFWFAKLLAARLSAVLLRCIPVTILSFLLPSPYRMTLPPNGINALLFGVSLLLAALLVIAISMLIYISVFITLSPTGSVLVFGVLGEFLAGMIIPLPLMPEWLQSVLMLLPFRWTADFPFRLYSGHIGVQEGLIGIGIQIVWIAALVGIGKYCMWRVMRKTVVQGG